MKSSFSAVRHKGALLVALAAILLATACETSTTIKPEESFDANAAHGLVVMGLSADHSRSFHYNFWWWKIDPATGSFAEGVEPLKVGWIPNPWFPSDLSDRTKKQYFIVRAPPGQYALESFRFDRRYTKKFRPGTVAFEVAAGEIVYIGDYLITAPLDGWFYSSRKADFKFGTRDDAAAQRAVDEYPGVTGRLKFIAPELLRLR